MLALYPRVSKALQQLLISSSRLLAEDGTTRGEHSETTETTEHPEVDDMQPGLESSSLSDWSIAELSSMAQAAEERMDLKLVVDIQRERC